MNFNLQKAVVLILCLNIVLFIGGVRVVENDSFLNRVIDMNEYQNNNTVGVSDNLQESIPTNYEETGGTSSISFIDTLGAVKDFLSFIVNIILTPLGLFFTLPAVASLVIGVPILIAGVIAFIYFIRSGR